MADLKKYQVRDAREEDCGAVLEMKQLLVEHHDLEQLAITEEDLIRDGFGNQPIFRCLVCEETADEHKQLVGYLIYYFVYDTSLGRTMWMEDLFVRDQCRKIGIGTALMKQLSKIVLETQCCKLFFETSAAKGSGLLFYKKHGAIDITDSDTRVLAMNKDALEELCSKEDHR